MKTRLKMLPPLFRVSWFAACLVAGHSLARPATARARKGDILNCIKN